MKFMFEVGKEYETQAGQKVAVIGRTDLRGYECLQCSDGRYRYDRSASSSDAGRVTGTAHDYSCEHNFRRGSRPDPQLAREQAADRRMSKEKA